MTMRPDAIYPKLWPSPVAVALVLGLGCVIAPVARADVRQSTMKTVCGVYVSAARGALAGRSLAKVQTSMTRRTTWWVHPPGGMRRLLGAGGVLVGRAVDCDLVVRDPCTSRRNALLYLDDEGPRIVALGRGEIKVGGALVTESAPLLPGDTIEVPGLTLEVEAEEQLSDRYSPWLIQAGEQGLFGVGPHGCVVGGGACDDLRIPGSAQAALTFRVAQGRLMLETGTEAEVNGDAVEPGTMTRLNAGAKIKLGETMLRVLLGTGSDADTTAQAAGSAEAAVLPHSVELRFLPRGGRLTLGIGSQSYSVYLSDRRCDFVACLLKPPRPYAGGEDIPEHVLSGRVWARQSRRSNLSVLLHRVRRDLVMAGVDGAAILARPEGGGAVRFSILDGATIRVA